MKFRIQKATVLGSGVMGSGIACHLANIGIAVLMLDIPPKSDNNKSKNRNIIADEALKKALTSKPAALYDKSYVNKISTGNFEDDFEKINDSDWQESIFTSSRQEATFSLLTGKSDQSKFEIFVDYIYLGFDHILEGYDHLAFLLAILLITFHIVY